ncbi:MAG TPA: hypothetical protein P5050_05895 [Bacteroidia bacterium]|nr:hypothetical protein [Bacteroidia bacterium]HRS58737.1 hypothetical protein [Bacteroidia bacterium]HRU67929.1 hypothetical protein [Bacteroidia bacterium]
MAGKRKINFQWSVSGIILLLLTLCIFKSPAQVYDFSKDPEKFQSEIRTLFKGIQVEKTNKIVDEFLLKLKNDQFSAEEFLKIVNTCNFMLKLHLKALPHFEQYLELLNAYKNNFITIDKFNQWDEVYREVAKNNKRYLDDFNACILALFSQNAVYSEVSKTWKINTFDYNIIYEKVPQIVVEHPISLTCRTKEDTLIIHQTTGIYYPIDYKWRGSNGLVNWRRVLLDTTEVYAKIRNYVINTKSAELEADSVEFWNKRYFSNKLFGKLWDRAMTTYSGVNSKYPKFRSYKAVYILDKLSKNVLYIGGFTQEGIDMLGSSSMDIPGEPKVKARVIISYKGKPTLRAESDAFLITPEKIVASNSTVSIYYQKDSLFHPKIIFNYSILTRKIMLTRGDNGMYRSPMYDTYHKLEMEFDQLEWNIDDPKMDMRLFYGSEGSAWFTSSDFFTAETFNKIQSVLDFNPVVKLKEISVRKRTKVISQAEFADYIGVQPEFVTSLLITLTMQGFIIYDEDKKTILIRDKTILYANAADNKMDYDLLRIESIIKKSNAVFSLESGNLDIEGVGNVLFSDSHKVYIYPQNQKLIIKNDRNMEFNGYVRAGLFEFFGSNFNFDYQTFKISMNNIDSLRFWVRIDPTKPTLIALIQSVLQNVSGYLYIDNPKNKSGRINYPEYPIFECTKNSFVYYDRKEILGGVYSRDRFYFEIKPFKVDSLYTFTMEGLTFDGTFHSGGIMPVFDYRLVPQKDRSLGFTKTDVFPLYINQGKPKGEGDVTISLSNKGLRGTGSIEYLTSITKSPDFIFFLDSVRANSTSFNLEHNAMNKYPKVIGQDVFTRWYPYKDTMIIEKLQIPFKIYEKGYDFSGNLVLTPARLSSSGTFDYLNSTISSGEFVFTPTKLLSEDATLRIESDDPNLSAIIAPNIKLDLDIEKDVLKGQSISDQHKILFPLNRYLTSMKKFVWYSLEDRVELNKGDFQADKDCYFMSTHKDQDSLQFQSTYAVYDLKKYYINAEKIPYIPVADARIFPFEGKAVIERDALMQSLKNAKVKADTINFYHELYDCLINVFGKYKYTGYGKYDYIDKYKTRQVLNFYQIRVDESRRTYARSKITDSMNFKLSPQFKFTGYADLNGNIRELDFDGFVFPDHKRPEFRTGWFSYHNRINPDSVYFALSYPKGKEGRELYTGIYLGTDSPYVYNLFLGYKKAFADQEIFTVTEGILYYDEKKASFVFADKDKIYYEELRGALFSLKPANGDAYGEGKFDFGEDIKAIDIATAGTFNYFAENGKFIFDIVMTIQFPFDEKAMNQMIDVVVQSSYFRKDTRNKRDAVQKGIAELVPDEKEMRTILAEIENFGQIPITKNLTKTFVLSDLKITFEPEERVFQSDDNMLGLISIRKATINKYIGGAMQLSKKRSGTSFTLYLESDKENFYFFKYNYGIFNVVSSDEEFNKIFTSTLTKYSENKYRLKRAAPRDLETFKKKMKLY